MATLLIMALPEESQNLFESSNIRPYYCGVGQLKAAFLTQKLILEKKPERVVNLGTAGSPKLPQGSLVECTSFVQRKANNFFAGQGKTLTTSPVTSLPSVICGSADFIEKKSEWTLCDIMDMEAYAIAYVCDQLKVPFTSIKYISDNSDENIISDWKKNLKTSAEKLLQQYLQLGLPS